MNEQDKRERFQAWRISQAESECTYCGHSPSVHRLVHRAGFGFDHECVDCMRNYASPHARAQDSQE